MLRVNKLKASKNVTENINSGSYTVKCFVRPVLCSLKHVFKKMCTVGFYYEWASWKVKTASAHA